MFLLKKGINEKKKPDIVGHNFVRSSGGWKINFRYSLLKIKKALISFFISACFLVPGTRLELVQRLSSEGF